MTSIFGQIVDADQVEAAVLETLRKWLPTYLAEIERQRGITPPGSLPRPRSWTVASSLDKWPDHPLPAVFAVSPGLAEEPLRTSRGGYRAPWGVGVAAVVSAKDRAASRRLAAMYGAAIRTCLLQHRSLAGFATGLDWIDEDLDNAPPEQARTLAIAQELFVVTVDRVLDPAAGPAQPDPEADPTEPYDDWPTVQTTDLDVEAMTS